MEITKRGISMPILVWHRAQGFIGGFGAVVAYVLTLLWFLT
jgi:hypothetical protein